MLVYRDLLRHGTAIGASHQFEIDMLLVGTRTRDEYVPVGVQDTLVDVHSSKQGFLPAQVFDRQGRQTVELDFYRYRHTGTPGCGSGVVHVFPGLPT